MELSVSLLDAKIKIARSNYKSDFIYENAKSGEYTFRSSKIYGLIGSRGSGNWALSYLLTGWSRAKNIKIMVDGKDFPLKEMRNICCYIGREHYYDVYPIKKRLTVKKTIEIGLKKSGNTIDTFQSVKEIFSLTSERENRSFKYLGNEH